MSRKKHGGGRRRRALEHDEPFRTCVACRAAHPREEMLRFARSPDGAIGFDVRARLPGRGAWTCASAACVRRAFDRGSFARAFDAPVIGSLEGLLSAVRITLSGEVAAGLGLLRRAARLAAGREDVNRALAEGRVSTIVLACDLSERTRSDVTSRAGAVAIMAGPPQEEVGRAIGRKPTGVLGLLGGPRAHSLVSDLARISRFDAPPARDDRRAAVSPSSASGNAKPAGAGPSGPYPGGDGTVGDEG